MAIYSESFSLFRYIVLIVSVFYIGFSLSRPDYWIARYNIANIQNISAADVDFLMNELSFDATPVIARLDVSEIREGTHITWDENVVSRNVRQYFESVLEANQGIYFRRANYSRIRARLVADRWIKNAE